MILQSEKMELRGITEKVSQKTQKTYKVANFEVVRTGEPVQVYLGNDFHDVANGSKGDQFNLYFEKNKFGLDLYKAEKVD